MKKFALIPLFIFALNCTGQSQKNNYTEILPLIDLWLDGQKDFDRLPGLSIAIVNDQEIIFKKGYGFADVEKKIPMKAETIFSICSISKLFTSIAIMQLWEQHKLSLDDSLSALLPAMQVKQQYAETVPITVRNMLSHSSGLPRDADSSWNPPNFYFLTADEFKKSLAQMQTSSAASTYFQYSNLAMSLLGEIVKQKSGKTYDEYVEENILKPLQLTNTHPYLPEKLWRNEMAAGYSALSRAGTRNIQPLFRMNAITPAAGYSSNVIDLAKFASWQFRLLSGNKAELLHPSTLREMQRIQWISPDKRLTWGLGFIIRYDGNNFKSVGHDGSCPGYVTVLALDPKKKIAVIVMVNSQGVDVYKYSDQVLNLLNKNIAQDSAAKNIDLSAYAGRYDNYTWSGETAIVAAKGKLLTIGLPSNNPADNIGEFKFISTDHFKRIRPEDGSLAEDVVFQRDASGKVKSFRINSRNVNKIE